MKNPVCPCQRNGATKGMSNGSFCSPQRRVVFARILPHGWRKKQEALAGLPLNDPRRKSIETAFTQAQKAVFDAQGRIKISDRLISHAALSRQIVMAGAFDHFQIWDATAWKSTRREQSTIEDLEL